MTKPSKPAIAAAKRLLDAGYLEYEIIRQGEGHAIETVAKLIDEAITEAKQVTLSGAKSAIDRLKERLAHVHRA